MSRHIRLPAVLALWGLIYWVSLYIIPSLGPLRSLREAWPWLGSGDITQTMFLIFSIACMLLIRRGDLARFGFRSTRALNLVRPLITIIIVQIVILFIGMVVMTILH